MTTVELSRRPERHEAAIRRLLTAADDAFVPPLTAAQRATVSRTGDRSGPNSIDSYVAACLDRPLIGAVDDDQLIGFGSIDVLTDGEPLADYTPTTHVSVLVVDETYRNRGIATAIYEYLCSSLPSDLQQPFVSTKTWSTNRPHIAILDTLGFDCVHRVVDDREPGIDTVYYARRLS